MTSRVDPFRLGVPRAALLGVAIAAALTLAACGKKDKEAAASQTAAKVNKEEITVHQINFLLAQQRALPPAQAASAGKLALERLIDQELALQKANDQKLDRDPRVIQQLEATRREIIARAYLEKVALGAPKPTPAEIRAYYDKNPHLFSDRRVYQFQEIGIVARPDQVDAVKAKAASLKSAGEFIAYLQANGLRYTINEATRGAEQVPMVNLDMIAALKDGQSLFNPTPTGATVLYLAASRSQPVDLEHATPAIEQFLLNERRRKLLDDDRVALRRSAKIEYLGEYAGGPGSAVQPASAPAEPPSRSTLPDAAPAASAASAAPEPPPRVNLPDVGPAASAAKQLEVPLVSTGGASMPSKATLDKGLQGMK